MLGPRQVAQPALFYEFSLDDHVPQDHLVRSIALHGFLQRFGRAPVSHGHVTVEQTVHQTVEIPELHRPHETAHVGDLRRTRAQVFGAVVERGDVVETADRAENAFEVRDLLDPHLDLTAQLLDLPDLVIGVPKGRLKLFDVLGQVLPVYDRHPLRDGHTRGDCRARPDREHERGRGETGQERGRASSLHR